jgi:hypothetical protein
MIRLQVTLNESEADMLAQLAASELRDPRDQLRLLLRQELERRSLWSLTADRLSQAKQEVGNEGVGSTTFVLDQLELSYQQAREQAQGWFRFSLIAACVGFVLVGIGVITVIFGQTTAGIRTAISSVIPDVAAALFFVQSKAANERVDTIQTKLTEACEVQTAVEIVNTISDPTAQDNLKAEIVRMALRLEQSASDSPLTPASVS